MSKQDEETRAFRNAIGAFATGVTIATTKSSDGSPIGVTASSFNSVSLDPPLILWSLGKSSKSYSAFCESGHFAVHVLKADQEEMSNRFARSGEDKFAGVEWSDGQLGSPILSDHAALFQCSLRHQYEGGDHAIFVGEVVAYETGEGQPLLFHGGRYVESRERPDAEPLTTVDTDRGQFTDDFVFYLISRAHYQTSKPAREKLAEMGSSMSEYLIMAALSMQSPLTQQELVHRLGHTGRAPTHKELKAMVERGLLERSDDGYVLAELGRDLFIETLSYGKAFEEDLLRHFTAAELADAKRVLRRIVELSGDGVPLNWRSE